ncbi:MAG: amino acid-binding protein [Actinobacteria bacterium]|nr:amino acid-binding protein [Actinomycetota bacterium]
MSSIAITVIGNDQPGIVAAVTRALFDVGCNLEDISSTILRGHFSMTMISRCPDGVDPSSLEDRLASVAAELNVVATARTVEDTPAEFEPPTHMVAVYGADKPGIVYRVADALARLGVNITDLNSRLIGEENDPVYALQIEVQAPPECNLDEVLPPLREELGVEISVHPIEADVL